MDSGAVDSDGTDGGVRAQPARLTSRELAERVDIPEAVIEVLDREGLLASVPSPDGPTFSPGDAEAIAAGLSLLDAGVPLDELLDLARRWDERAREVADEAVELFLRFVRDPIQGSAASEQEAAGRLTTAFDRMFPAAGHLVAHHFRALLLERAAARIRSDGDADELAALARVEVPKLRPHESPSHTPEGPTHPPDGPTHPRGDPRGES